MTIDGIYKNGKLALYRDFLGKVNLSEITTESQYWQDSKQKNKRKELENKINDFSNTIILMLKSKTWVDKPRKQLKTEFEKLKNCIISAQKVSEVRALENVEDIFATKKLNTKLENIMKEIHKSEDFFAKTKHYKAFDTTPEKRNEELWIFKRLDWELRQAAERSTSLKTKFEKSIEAIRPFKVIQSLIDRFKRLLSAGYEMKQREDAFTEISKKIMAESEGFQEKITSIENPSLLRSFAYVLEDLGTFLKQAEKLNNSLSTSIEIAPLQEKIKEMTESFNTRMETLKENEIKKKEDEEQKEKITYLQNWKFPKSWTTDSKASFPYWEHDYRDAIETVIHKYGEKLSLKTPPGEHSQYQKKVVLSLEKILDSVVSTDNVSKIENIKQIEISVKLAKKLKKAINAIDPHSTSNKIKLKEFKKRMLTLKRAMEEINHLPAISSEEIFDFKNHPPIADLKKNNITSESCAYKHYVKDNQNMLKKAYHYLGKLRSHEALRRTNITDVIKNPIILKQLEPKFQEKESLQFILDLKNKFRDPNFLLTQQDQKELLISIERLSDLRWKIVCGY